MVLSIMPKIPGISVGIQMERSVPEYSGSPLISVGIFRRPKFAVPFLTNRFFALIREFGKGKKEARPPSIPILVDPV